MKTFRCSTGKWIAVVMACLVAADIPIQNAVAATAADPSQDAANFVYPSDGGILNVKEHGAKGDGVTDDTAAIQALIGRKKMLYFPSGTYLVSKRLEWKMDINDPRSWTNYCYFLGQNRATTIIKLKDNAPDFQDPAKPLGVICTASQGGAPYPAFDVHTGGGYAAFRNCVCDMTVDTGKGNPGAMGIDFMANNTGTVRDVTIRSGDGRGHSGLDMTRRWPGPCMISNVRIEGFDVGIDIKYTEYSVTLEHISLAGQHVAGLRNDSNVVSIRDLKSENTVPAVQNVTDAGMITLVDGTFTGGAQGSAAIENNGFMFARNIKTTGYANAIKNGNQAVPGTDVTEWTSNKVLSDFPSPQTSLNLPVEETPEWHDNDMKNWANVRSFEPPLPAVPDKKAAPPDDTKAIQAAIDSGKSTVYFPPGDYYISDTIHVRGKVRRLLGFYSSYMPAKNNTFDASHRKAMWRIEDGTGDTVFFEEFIGRSTGVKMADVEDATSRTLVLRNAAIASYRNTPNCGKLFMEDVQGNYHLMYPQKVWARQFDSEGGFSRAGMINNGGQVWILGLKHEENQQVIETTGGGKTELLGALLYPNAHGGDIPAFINNESQVSLVFAESVSRADRNYTNLVREMRGGETKILTDTSAYPRKAGVGACAVPLYVGYKPGGTGGISPPAILMYVDTPYRTSQFMPVFQDTGAPITAIAEAVDPAGVRDVEFFNGTTSVGKVTTPPYVVKITGLAPATPATPAPATKETGPPGLARYRITAVATNNKGVSETSAPVDVFINEALKLTILSPDDGMMMQAPAQISISAKVVADAPLLKIYFVHGGEKAVEMRSKGQDTEGTFTQEYKDLPAGFHTFTVFALDHNGGKSERHELWAAVSDADGPAITITAPVDGATVPGDGLDLSVDIPAGATLKKVAFFDGAKHLGIVGKAPYHLKVKSLTPGAHVLIAQATDAQGHIRFSKPVHVTVSEAPLPTATPAPTPPTPPIPSK